MTNGIVSTNSERILIVDDTPANLHLLRDILMCQGYTVHPTGEGELALELARSTPPDLILLDIRMPGMDGFEVCRQLKADERTCSIPIIFISVLEDAQDKVKGFQVGGVDYITKPFQPEEVLARVRLHLKLRDLTERLEKTISDLKLAQEALREYKDDLEVKVQQRSSELMLTLDAAETANRAKSVFLANITHELRTPLNAILGFSSLIRKNPQLPESERENINIINRSGQHLLSVLNNVLEISSIEAGRLQLENTTFDLGAMVRDVTDMMAIRAQVKGLHLLIDQSSHFPRYIVGDEDRLSQILINLLGNAIRYTHQGGVTLRLGTMKSKGPQLRIEVEDTGIGISIEDQQRIFEPFVQLGEHAINKGTGLGLAIVRKFIQMMDGSISVESTPDKGSLFRVDLPLHEASEADISKPKLSVYGEVTGLAPGQPEYRILIAEDQLDNQLLLLRLLETVGFQVKLANNGKEAVQLFQSWKPHFIWMDWRMPEMDGMEAARLIRELPGGKEVKIAAVTASAFIEQRREIFECGMDDYVRKPYREAEIYDCMARHLGVKYLFEDVPALEQPTGRLAPVKLETLRSELIEAVESLESDRIDAVIEKFATHDKTLYKTLSQHAENFDYPAILRALDE